MGKIKAYCGKKVENIQIRISNALDDISLKHKLIMMYIFCVLLPLFVTDSVILSTIVRADRDARKQEMNNTADAIEYSLTTTVENAVNLIQNVYRNRYVNQFIEAEYSSPLDYYISYIDFLKDSLYESVIGSSSYHTVIYADNPGFINGGYFSRLETVSDSEWYREFADSERNVLVVPYYEVSAGSSSRQKKLSVIRKLDYYHKGQGGNVVKLDLDYSAIIRGLLNAHYADTAYICCEGKILFSNDGRGGINMPFESVGTEIPEQAGVHRQMQVFGKVWEIYLINRKATAMEVIKNNRALVLLLLMVNILLPLAFMRLLNRSFTVRLRTLGEIFEKENGDQLPPLMETEGKDEIGTLMRSYNQMAQRMNELIQTVYKEKLKEQEMDIARQAAELLALHSQINPHFLFNALESIRMHSILKKEYETADMVEKLAIMERQNVEWSNDSVRIDEEIRFVEAYLDLQKYRFGERLSYQIDVEERFRETKIPKLTLVTFVENACVHGMENKTSVVWIFVRISGRDGRLCIEIEDTGAGMPSGQARELQEKMNLAKMEQLKEKGRVGILNACIRLKMMTKRQVLFELESEEGVGTMVTIHIPLEKDKEGEKTC